MTYKSKWFLVIAPCLLFWSIANSAQEFKIDIDSTNIIGGGIGAISTETGWVSLDATQPSNGDSVTVDGVKFEVFSADGSRIRPSDTDPLLTDFIFDDGTDEIVGLKIFDLPVGLWEAKVWAFDNDYAVGALYVGITQFNADPDILFTNSFVANDSSPFTFVFDSSSLVNGFGIFTGENNSNNRTRFNALQLTAVPAPTDKLFWMLLTLFCLGLFKMSRLSEVNG